MVGVNGTGKTTTVGKLARLLSSSGVQPLICAGDTFRAAAVEQLEVWARRAQVDIVQARTQPGSSSTRSAPERPVGAMPSSSTRLAGCTRGST